MHRLVAVPVIAAFLALTACAPVKPLVVAQAIGPFEGPVPTPWNGTLVVYSELESLNGDPEYLVHSAYKILTPEGTLVREVPNHDTVADREPTPVWLPPGKYKVVARESYHGTVSLLAVIDAGRKTVIDLNEEVVPSRSSRDQNWVRLPSGQIVGRTAD
jgi:hypothetical protein